METGSIPQTKNSLYLDLTFKNLENIIRIQIIPIIIIPQTVCPHYGVLTVGVRSGVLRGVLPQPRLSTAQARTEFRLRRQCRTEW